MTDKSSWRTPEKTKAIDKFLKPKLAKNTTISLFKEDELGKSYLLRNIQDSSYIKINEAGNRVLQMFDGNTPLREIGIKTDQQNIEIDVYEFTRFLAERGFIENVDCQRKSSRESSLDSFTSIKYTLFKANSPLALKIYGLYKIVFSKLFIILYAILCGSALILFFNNFSKIMDDAFSVLDPKTALLPFIVAFLLFYPIDLMHEVAHAAVFNRLGGVPQRIGYTFHFLVPFFFTDVPDVRSFTLKKSIIVFLAGPLSTLFFGSVSLMAYFVEPTFKAAWAMLTIGCYLSIVFTLTPFIKTDGYYILETLLKFPNLLTHALRNIKNYLKHSLRMLSDENYRESRQMYSKFERKALDTYSFLLPLGMALMIYFGAIIAFVAAWPKILIGISWVFSKPVSANLKAYLVVLIPLSLVVQISFGTVVTAWRFTRTRWELSRFHKNRKMGILG
jgi:hypothetical protein